MIVPVEDQPKEHRKAAVFVELSGLKTLGIHGAESRVPCISSTVSGLARACSHAAGLRAPSCSLAR